MSVFYQRIPIIGSVIDSFLKFSDRLRVYSPEELEKINNEQKKYRETIGLGNDFTLNDKSIDTYNKARERTQRVLMASVHKKLVAAGCPANEAEEIEKDIISRFEPSKEFKTATQNYHDFIQTFQKQIQEIPQTRNAKSLIDEMTKEIIKAGKAIQNQQQHDKANTEQIEQSKKGKYPIDMTDALDNFEKAQKKNLEDFDKSTVADLVKMHGASTKENSRQLFIKNLYENNSAMKEKIDEIIKNRSVKNQQVEVVFEQYDDKIDISGISLDDLESIKGLDYWNSVGKGREIEKSENGKSYVLTFTRRIWSPLYYLDPRQNVLADLTLLAQTIKAHGHNTITMRVTFPDDQKLAMERARQAYEACIRSGFEPKNISLVINGQEYKHNPDPKNQSQQSIGTVLFKDKAEEYNNLDRLSQKTIAALNKIYPPAKSSAQIKSEIETQRTKEKESAANLKQDTKEEQRIIKNSQKGS